jgi:hypothetical protein
LARRNSKEFIKFTGLYQKFKFELRVSMGMDAPTGSLGVVLALSPVVSDQSS